MSTDRELLEMAAKAVGISPGIGGALWTKHGGLFEPLEDDADAFWLAVQLRLEPRFIDNSKLGVEPSRVALHNFAGIVEDVGDDPYAATRRAIVRAAAAIAKAMP